MKTTPAGLLGGGQRRRTIPAVPHAWVICMMASTWPTTPITVNTSSLQSSAWTGRLGKCCMIDRANFAPISMNSSRSFYFTFTLPKCIDSSGSSCTSGSVYTVICCLLSWPTSLVARDSPHALATAVAIIGRIRC
jgi:hypothetical protein